MEEPTPKPSVHRLLAEYARAIAEHGINSEQATAVLRKDPTNKEFRAVARLADYLLIQLRGTNAEDL